MELHHEAHGEAHHEVGDSRPDHADPEGGDPLEEGDEENDQMTEAKDSPSSKKKIWESETEEGDQASLFGEETKESKDEQVLVNGQPPKTKTEKPKEAKQSSLFGEKEKSDEEKVDKDEEGFTPGQTIELDL